MDPRQTLVGVYLIADLALSTAPSYAVSCAWWEDRYVVACSEGGCVPRFRARDVRTHGFSICARRVVIEEFPGWAIAPVQEVLRAQREQRPLGTLEILLEHRHFLEVAQNAAWLREALQSPRSREHRVQIRAAPEGEVTLRTALDKRSVDELWASRRAWAIDAVIAMVVGVVLIGPCAWFVRQVRRQAHLWVLGSALALDTVVFLLGFRALMRPVGPMAAGLAAPLAMLVALVEVTTFTVARIRRWRVSDRYPPGSTS